MWSEDDSAMCGCLLRQLPIQHPI